MSSFGLQWESEGNYIPIHDYRCVECGEQKIDHIHTMHEPNPEHCGQPMEKLWTASTTGAFQDDIPGGILIHHGLCNADGTPRRYYSKSEIAREAAKRGLINYVEHVPSPGSDKNRRGHTVRWV